MSFNKVYEILCDTCMMCLVHAYSIKECEAQIQDSGWHTKGKKHYCSDKCLEEQQ